MVPTPQSLGLQRNACAAHQEHTEHGSLTSEILGNYAEVSDYDKYFPGSYSVLYFPKSAKLSRNSIVNVTNFTYPQIPM